LSTFPGYDFHDPKLSVAVLDAHRDEMESQNLQLNKTRINNLQMPAGFPKLLPIICCFASFLGFVFCKVALK